MTGDAYERLADALDRLPNGFPRTASGAEIRLLQKIFAPQEAALVGRRRCSRRGAGFQGASRRQGLPICDWRLGGWRSRRADTRSARTRAKGTGCTGWIG